MESNHIRVGRMIINNLEGNNTVPPQGNSPSLDDLMKQLATSNLEFQQTMNPNNMQFQKNLNATIQDLKT
ncbi:hypothetical protein CR513_04361, partial [Mucuna pruriens]